MARKIKIMLVEDNPEYRHVIQFSLQDDPTHEIISLFGTAEQALRSLQNMDTRNVPHVILLDLNLPGISGLDALPEFARQIPESKIIILTQSDREADVLTAIRAGAAGYLLKSASVQEIKAGIESVMDGGASMDPKMALYLLNNFKNKIVPVNHTESLTERELQVLTLISQGLARKQISDSLSISAKTVDNHIAHIFEKLNVPNAPSAIAKAFRIGIFKHSES